MLYQAVLPKCRTLLGEQTVHIVWYIQNAEEWTSMLYSKFQDYKFREYKVKKTSIRKGKKMNGTIFFKTHKKYSNYSIKY